MILLILLIHIVDALASLRFRLIISAALRLIFLFRWMLLSLLSTHTTTHEFSYLLWEGVNCSITCGYAAWHIGTLNHFITTFWSLRFSPTFSRRSIHSWTWRFFKFTWRVLFRLTWLHLIFIFSFSDRRVLYFLANLVMAKCLRFRNVLFANETYNLVFIWSCMLRLQSQPNFSNYSLL
jgi:hypothetical protein